MCSLGCWVSQFEVGQVVVVVAAALVEYPITVLCMHYQGLYYKTNISNILGRLPTGTSIYF